MTVPNNGKSSLFVYDQTGGRTTDAALALHSCRPGRRPPTMSADRGHNRRCCAAGKRPPEVTPVWQRAFIESGQLLLRVAWHIECAESSRQTNCMDTQSTGASARSSISRRCLVVSTASALHLVRMRVGLALALSSVGVYTI